MEIKIKSYDKAFFMNLEWVCIKGLLHWFTKSSFLMKISNFYYLKHLYAPLTNLLVRMKMSHY